MPSVETVAGPVDLDDLGTTLVHEHLRLRSSPADSEFPHLYDEADAHRRAAAVAGALVAQGVKTICDPSCMYHGRDVRFLARVGEETGLQVVPCTASTPTPTCPSTSRIATPITWPRSSPTTSRWASRGPGSRPRSSNARSTSPA